MRHTPWSAMEAINQAFLGMSRAEGKALMARKYRLSVKRGMSMYTAQGQVRVIDVQPRPWLVSAEQRAFFYRACLVMRGALARTLPLYLQNARVRRTLPLHPTEHDWIVQANARRLQRPQPVIDRIDSTATFAVPDWRENFWFLEPNSVGIGGIHYIRAAAAVSHDWILPFLKSQVPGLHFEYHDDLRELIFKTLMRHAKALGRKLRRVAFIEDQSEAGGTHEFPSVAKYFTQRGLPSITADPRDIRIRGSELTVRGRPIDIFYRDSEITEMIEMAGRRPQKVAGMKEAFLRNQVISALAGEFDHKSAWELFTSPEFARYYTPAQKKIFKAHVLWTRLAYERKTSDPSGKIVDLVSYTRRHREDLVIKPNREYGGEGVMFGHEVTQAIWERELAKALGDSYNYVIQQAVPVHVEIFPQITPKGSVQLTPIYVVTGFAATQDGIAFLGRASREAVVNVSRKGGLIAAWRLGS